MEIQFDGNYDRQMFMHGLKMLDNRKPLRRILRLLVLLILVFVLGAATYEWFQKGASRGELGRPLFVALILFYYFVAPYAERWGKARRAFGTVSTRQMVGKADSQGILIGPVAGNTARFKWDRFLRSAVQGEYAALMALDGSMALFHRSFFKSEPEWSRFLRLLEQKVIRPK
jgi:hypothetical protein